MILFDFPMISTVFAQADGLIRHYVFCGGHTGGFSYVFLFAENLGQESGDEKEDPQKYIYEPPPAADKYPPKDAVPLLLVF